MKLPIFALCLSLAGGAAFAAPAAQASTTKAAAKTTTPKPKMMWASGTIEKFDASTKMLTVKQNGKDVTFTVNEQTHVMKGKEKLSDSALTSGEHAKVEYTLAGGNKEAHVIELTAAKAAPKKP